VTVRSARAPGIGIAAAAATGVQVGLAMVATRAIAEDLGPLTLAWARYGIALLVLLPLRATRPRVRVARADLAPILILGVVQFGLLIVCLNLALAWLPAGPVAVIFATVPALTLGLGVILHRAVARPVTMAGIALSIAGVAVILGGPVGLGTSPWGAVAALAAAGCGAGAAVLYGPYLERYPTLEVGTLAMAGAFGALSALVWVEAPLGAIRALDLPGWGVLGFIGLASGAGYLLWLTALRHAGPARATVFLNLSPVTAVALGAVVLGEGAGPLLWAGLCLVAAGVAMAVTGRN